jgi:hypothetical protein
MISIGYAWGAIFLCLIGYGILSLTYPARMRARRFAGREELSLHDLFLRFYKESSVTEETFSQLWNEAADALGIASGRLRPSDRFDNELGPVKAFPLVDVNETLLSLMVRKLRSKDPKAKPSELKDLQTLNDYILFFGASGRGES